MHPSDTQMPIVTLITRAGFQTPYLVRDAYDNWLSDHHDHVCIPTLTNWRSNGTGKVGELRANLSHKAVLRSSAVQCGVRNHLPLITFINRLSSSQTSKYRPNAHSLQTEIR